MAIDAQRAGCPEAGELAAYIEHALPSAARAAVEAHLVECADCRHVLVETAAWVDTSRRDPAMVSLLRRHWLRVGAAVAAAAVVVVAVRLKWPSADGESARPEIQELAAAVAREATRPIDGRLAGGFPYAPPPSPLRSASKPAGADTPRVQVIVAAIEREARANPSPEREAALGVAYLVSGDVDGAITALERATAERPDYAAPWSNLAAAYIERGLRTGGDDDYERARSAANRALALDSRLAEAAFNLALALEHAGDREAAIAAWRRVSEVDRGSPWASEGDRRAQSLGTPQ